FVSRRLLGDHVELLQERGIAVHVLPQTDVRPITAADDPPHAHWLAVPWQNDARETRELLERLQPDWLIVDHYALDARWEAQAAPPGTKIMAIDDLADRPHRCEVLLDQNLGRKTADYQGLMPPVAVRLIGPRYALLRPEFAAYRQHSLARRREPELRHILISMGGIDKDNVTSAVLRTLEETGLADTVRVSVVMGPSAPWLEEVQRLAASSQRPTNVRVGVDDMAALMSEADLSIGAAGTTAWERCCLGLPAIIAVLADNQLASAHALTQVGAVLSAGRADAPDFAVKLIAALDTAADPATLQNLTAADAAVTDGKGAERMSRAITMPALTLRDAGHGDAEAVWRWRHHGDAWRLYRSGCPTPLSDHLAWFKKALRDGQRHLLMVCDGDQPVAHVRLDRDAADPASGTVGICVDPDRRGEGLAVRALALALSAARERSILRVSAEIHDANQASLHAFEGVGFQRTESHGPFQTWQIDVSGNFWPEAERDGH
ncbi:MAG: UDP-2,4-diacetamido-2,4,6-trideoxy-beta-L-altropyranose hydrolase, partial [Pseudomonadota bacterium]